MKYFPAWFPGGGFQRKAKVTRDKIPEFRLSPYQAVKNGIVRIVFVTTSFVANYPS